mgnify:CR=1 FL=1
MRYLIVLSVFFCSLVANDISGNISENKRDEIKTIQEHNDEYSEIKSEKILLKKFDVDISGEFTIRFDSSR